MQNQANMAANKPPENPAPIIPPNPNDVMYGFDINSIPLPSEGAAPSPEPAKDPEPQENKEDQELESALSGIDWQAVGRGCMKLPGMVLNGLFPRCQAHGGQHIPLDKDIECFALCMGLYLQKKIPQSPEIVLLVLALGGMAAFYMPQAIIDIKDRKA
jgi:hypothetical protein